MHERRRNLSKNALSSSQYKIADDFNSPSQPQGKIYSDITNTVEAHLESGEEEHRHKKSFHPNSTKSIPIENQYRHLGLQELRRAADCEDLANGISYNDGYAEESPRPNSRKRVQR